MAGGSSAHRGFGGSNITSRNPLNTQTLLPIIPFSLDEELSPVFGFSSEI